LKTSQSEVLFTYLSKDIYSITLENDQGMKVCLSNYGGLIQSIILPDKFGNFIDVVLGFDTIQEYISTDYLAHYPYFGAIIGRYANRIANARFPLNGEMIEVSANTPPHQLHGGFSGFDKKVWDFVSLKSAPFPKATFQYLSKDGEEGFPGNLTAEISFELNNLNELTLKIEAHADQATAINMTHHGYFNLNGDGGSIADHVVEISATHYLAQDADYVSTGELIAVDNTSHDFRTAKKISHDWEEGEGYDQAFVLDKSAGLWGTAAIAYSEQTGIKLTVLTDQPGVQFYTGKYLNVQNGKKGMHYRPFTAFCLETQQHTNAVNIPQFANTILEPGEKYRHIATFKFSVD
jgi:aldose 1-epimerase